MFQYLQSVFNHNKDYEPMIELKWPLLYNAGKMAKIMSGKPWQNLVIGMDYYIQN